MLYPPLYSSYDPELFGFPFFYEERDTEGAGPLPATPEEEPRFTHEPQPTRQR